MDESLSFTTDTYQKMIDENIMTEIMNVTDSSIDMGEFDMGPNRDPLYVVIPITIIYVIIFITGLLGNISTCIVISRNKSMHTATNYYLFSLAISDLLLLITGLPPEIYLIWSKYPYVFGEVFCVLRGLAAETSANATVLTITAFTVERYVAICHPFLSHTMSKLSRAIKLILIIWLVALVFAVPQALQFGLLTHNGIVICTQNKVLLEHSFEISTFLFFVMPMTLITVLYALIGLRLRSSNMMKRERSTRPLRNTNNGRNNTFRRSTSQSSRRVLKMLVAVVIAFFICWAPFHTQRLVAIYGTGSNHQATSPMMLKIYAITTYISGVLYYVSTTINPVLYHIMSNKFREAFKETVGKCWGGGGRRDYRELARANNKHNQQQQPQHDSTDYSETLMIPSGINLFEDKDRYDGVVVSNKGNSVREESFTSGGGMHRYDTIRSTRSTRRGASSLCTSTDTNHTYLQYTTSVCSKSSSTSETKTSKTSPPIMNDKQTNTGIYFQIETTETNSFQVRDRPTGVWYVFGCLSVDKVDVNSPYAIRSRLSTVENETQTENENFRMVTSNISNSSLMDVDRSAFDDELTLYMEELYRREKYCQLNPIKT